jgi:hypothetical protein
MPLLIFDTAPLTWQELEEMVHQAFDEMGYETARNVEISTARGTVKVDVRAVKKSNPIPTHVLCECKYWNKRVEQSAIHSFRSICSDAGAHYGLIISKVGFQSGANESRSHTNIHLLNFVEFQSTFFDEWRSGLLMKFARMFDSLIPIIPMNPNYARDKALQAKLSSFDIFRKYEIFFGGNNNYTAYFVHQRPFPTKIVDPRGDPASLREITVETPRQFFEIARQGCTDARAFFGI